MSAPFVAVGELHGVFTWLFELLESTGLTQPWLDVVVYTALGAFMFGLLSLFALFLVWWERKIAAHIQQRFGPMRVGWHGWYQTIMDAVKLLQKEDIRVAIRDKAVFFWAPVLCFVAAFLAYVVMPFGDGLIVADLNIGILYVMAVTTFTVISLLMAGWGSHNKYALLGGMRSAAQVVSYEVPMAVSLLAVILFVGSLSMVDIVEAQSRCFFFLSSLCHSIFIARVGQAFSHSAQAVQLSSPVSLSESSTTTPREASNISIFSSGYWIVMA